MADQRLPDDARDALADAIMTPYSLTRFLTGDLAPLGEALRNRWITELHEFVSCWGALQSCDPEKVNLVDLNLAFMAMKQNPPLNFREGGYDLWEEFCDFWLEGCDSPAEFVSVVPDVRDPTAVVPFDPEVPLPGYAFLGADLPIRNQHTNGPCVAYAIAAAVEIATGRRLDDETILSFYNACRAFYGLDSDDPEGSVALSAMQLARELGFWEGERVMDPGQILLMKKALAGVGAAQGVPVVVRAPVFVSASNSKACFLSGKWTLPFPGESPVGYHAVALVGYRDDASVPGGGYFIARNSWGEDYAADSPEGKPGHSLIPFAYLQRYCVESYAALPPAPAVQAPHAPLTPADAQRPRAAASAPVNASERQPAEPNLAASTQNRPQPQPRTPTAPEPPAAPTPVDDFRARYVRTLTVAAPDVDGVVRAAGVNAIASPRNPAAFRIESPANVAAFKRNGYAWTVADRVANFFPALTAAQREETALRLNAQSRFTTGIEANMNALAGVPSLLSRRGFFSAPRIKAPERLADLSEPLRIALARRFGLPSEEDKTTDLWTNAPAEYRPFLDSTASAVLWRVADDKAGVGVAVIFLAPARFGCESSPEREAPGEVALQTALEILDAWRRAHEDASVLGWHIAVGSYDGALDTLDALFDKRDAYSLSVRQTPDAGDAAARFWRTKTSLPDERIAQISGAAVPTDLDELVRILRVVADREAGYFPGDLTVEYLSRKSGLSVDETTRAFYALVNAKEYGCVTTSRGELALKPR